MGPLRLRRLTDDDEAAFLSAHQELLADGFTFALGHRDDMSWPRYLHRLAAASHGRDLEPGQVASILLVADVGGTIVGRTSIRHELNEFLAHEGGHIGYGVVPGLSPKGLRHRDPPAEPRRGAIPRCRAGARHVR